MTVKCIECGSMVELTDKFCGECGRPCVEYGIISECGTCMYSIDRTWVNLRKDYFVHEDTLTFTSQHAAQLYFNFANIYGCVVALNLQGAHLE